MDCLFGRLFKNKTERCSGTRIGQSICRWHQTMLQPVSLKKSIQDSKPYIRKDFCGFLSENSFRINCVCAKERLSVVLKILFVAVLLAYTQSGCQRIHFQLFNHDTTFCQQPSQCGTRRSWNLQTSRNVLQKRSLEDAGKSIQRYVLQNNKGAYQRRG